MKGATELLHSLVYKNQQQSEPKRKTQRPRPGPRGQGLGSPGPSSAGRQGPGAAEPDSGLSASSLPSCSAPRTLWPQEGLLHWGWGSGGRRRRAVQHPPPAPQALGSKASTSLQTLRTEQEVELFSYWNFLRETKKAMPKFTFKV